jgi:hypothetical protein
VLRYILLGNLGLPSKSKLEPGRLEPGRLEPGAEPGRSNQRLSINQSLDLEGPRGPSNTTLAISKKYFLII